MDLKLIFVEVFGEKKKSLMFGLLVKEETLIVKIIVQKCKNMLQLLK